MKQYTVTGMSCAACSARVEKAVSKVDGVTSCSVSLLTNSMGVEGSATDAQIVEAVEQAGYGASPKGTATESENDKANNSLEQLKAAQDALVDRETPKLRNRLIASLIFLVVLMYFSMGHMMWGWPLPEFSRSRNERSSRGRNERCIFRQYYTGEHEVSSQSPGDANPACNIINAM